MLDYAFAGLQVLGLVMCCVGVGLFVAVLLDGI